MWIWNPLTELTIVKMKRSSKHDATDRPPNASGDQVIGYSESGHKRSSFTKAFTRPVIDIGHVPNVLKRLPIL